MPVMLADQDPRSNKLGNLAVVAGGDARRQCSTNSLLHRDECRVAGHKRETTQQRARMRGEMGYVLTEITLLLRGSLAGYLRQ